MCGILAGFQRGGPPLMREAADRMLNELRRRGPDEQTVFQHGPATLGHTRLSIIDLSTGTQPLFNEDRTAACILNGEIYNFQQLRDELRAKGHAFKTTSDTEAIVHLYEELGERVFERLDGMFAIVIYDLKKNRMLVGRDRMGEKPVLYHASDRFFACASELKCLLKYPEVKRDLDPEAIAAYLSTLYVPAPLSIFKSVRKLRPGSYLKITADRIEEKAYWQPQVMVRWDMPEEEAIAGIREQLARSVAGKLVADVPLGVFLSGGIDSSAVVAMMSKAAKGRIKTYSVGFGKQIDELPFARQVAERYQTDHTEIHVESRIERDLPEVAAYFDEPFADTSSIPTYLISKEARKHVKVVLTGDGGDELFAGYEGYINQKRFIGQQDTQTIGGALDRMMTRLGRDDGWYPLRNGNSARAHWFRSRSYFSDREIAPLLRRELRTGRSADDLFPPFGLRMDSDDPLSLAYAFDLNYYLADDLLKKVDMAAMAHGLECRAPFLDHRLIEFAMSIPPHLKLKGNRTKYLLRKAMEKDLPEGLAWREKHGFGSPIGAWINGELKGLIQQTLLDRPRIHEILEPAEVRRTVRLAEERGDDNWKYPFRVWILLNLELWMRNYL